MSRTLLTLVGALYVGLAMWCTVDPEQTSAKVGLLRQGGQGHSEYLVIYGGLQLSLGLMFLLPLVRKSAHSTMLMVCVIVHLCLVTFRTAAFLQFAGFTRMTYQLAAGEWIILLLSCGAWLHDARSRSSDHASTTSPTADS